SAWLKYGASPQRLSVWLKIARTEGLSGLNQFKRRGRPLCMGNQERTENL
ncbi:MAG TPA: helix-turn-helix domain-containing protein, partial [Xylanibacter oryzae]|nr:helix-turn-helix domain-containing protein [Xylanibacter oryzae]